MHDSSGNMAVSSRDMDVIVYQSSSISSKMQRQAVFGV